MLALLAERLQSWSSWPSSNRSPAKGKRLFAHERALAQPRVEIGGLALLSASATDPGAIVFQAIREIEVVLPVTALGCTPPRMACHLSYDGLDREFKFFDRLDGDVCTERPRKSRDNHLIRLNGTCRGVIRGADVEGRKGAANLH